MVFSDGKNGDIVNQYVAFTRILREQTAVYGRELKALEETIRICKERNILKEYLESREKEVVNIMITLFDHERIQELYLRDAINEGVEKGVEKRLNEVRNKVRNEVRNELEAEYSEREEEVKKGVKLEESRGFAKSLFADTDLSIDAIARYSRLPLEEVQALAREARP